MIRQFKNNLKETGMVLGQLFMPLLENLLPALNGLTIAFKRLFTSIASVFGIKINLEEFGEGYTETEDTLGDIADSYDEATSAAKKYQNQILGFDEVTKLQDTSATDSGSSGGAGGTIDLTDEILKATEEYEKAWEEAYDRMENKANSIADRISKAFSDGWKDSDFSSIGGYVGESFNKSLEGMNWSSIKKTGKKMSTSFATLLNGFFATPNLFSNIGTSIAEGLNTAVMMSSTFAGTLDWSEMGNSIASGINDFFDTFDFPSLAEKTNKWVQGVSEAFITAITNIDWLNIYDKFTEYLANIDIKTASIIISSVIVKKILSLNIASAVISAIGLSISQKIAGAIASTLGLSIASNAGIGNALLTAGASIGSTFITGFKAFLGSSSASAALAFINPVTVAIAGIGSIIAGVGVAFLNFFSMLDGGFNWVKEALMLVGIAIAAVGAVILGAPAFVAGVVAGIVGIVATMVVVIKENWDSIADFASKTWENISKLFSTVANWFNINVIIPVKSFFLNLCSKIGTFFSNLWSGISSIWSTVSNWFSLNVIEPIVGFFSAFSARVKVIFEGLWILVRAVWVLASSWFSNYVTTPISNAFSFLSSNVARFFSNLWSSIQNIWRNVSSWFSNYVITPVRNLFSNVTSFISNVFNNAKTMVVNIWSNFSTWISNNVTTPVVNIFNNACDRIGGFFSSLWSGIKSGLASAMNVVIYGIESGINFIVSGLNGIIGGFNKIVTVAAKIVGADWSGVKKLSKVDLGRISVSAYATGGFPEDGLFYANHTELVGQFSNGKTAVANNEQITQGIANAVYPAVYNAVSQAMRSNSSGNADVVVNIDGKEVFHAVQTQATNYTRRTGKLAFPV